MTLLPLIDTSARVRLPILAWCDGYSDEERAVYLRTGEAPEGIPEGCPAVTLRPLSHADVVSADAEAGAPDAYALRLMRSGDAELSAEDRARVAAEHARVLRVYESRVALATVELHGLESLQQVPAWLYPEVLGELHAHVDRISGLSPLGKARPGRRSPGRATGG